MCLQKAKNKLSKSSCDRLKVSLQDFLQNVRTTLCKNACQLTALLLIT